jgi:hypothetical protein
MVRKAKDQAEYDEAVSIISWLNKRGQEILKTGDMSNAQKIATATDVITEIFLPPENSDRARLES